MKLELRGITKTFGTFVANDSIDLMVQPGQIHAILGENGAGKSTLMNTLYGLYEPDAGQILLDDQPVAFAGPGQAMASGIGMVHQHFMLVPVFTVAENIVLGQEPTAAGGLLDLAAARDLVTTTAQSLGFHLDPDARIEDLSVGAQQRVEIVKALSRQAEVLILDEPTAVLTPQETDELIQIMGRLRDAGTSIIFITHKLREVRAIADEITIIRLGKVVGSAEPTMSETELASMMVGRSVNLGVEKGPSTAGNPALSITDLNVIDGNGVRVVKDVSLEVARGEIVALAGVQGNGQTELTEAILGTGPASSGKVELDGVDITRKGVRARLNAGLGFVPEDRTTDGIVADLTITENLVLDLVGAPPYSKAGLLQTGFLRENAQQRVEEFDVRTTSIDRAVGTLSGGNQQKVVLARELSRELALLVASQPTRGLDVGSIEFVHSRIVTERDRGAGVLIVSTELDEVLALADRIAVMCAGVLVGIVDGNEDRDVIGLMMTGIAADEARQQARTHHTVLGSSDLHQPGPWKQSRTDDREDEQ
ncbi:MAG: ABC transporter ATP-binding protein [Beutenbergiaceae bacterium]